MSVLIELREPYLNLFKLILKHFDDPETDGILQFRDLKAIGALNHNSGLIRPGLNWLLENDFLDSVMDDEGLRVGWQFSQKGAEAAYELIAGSSNTGMDRNDKSVDDDSFIDLTDRSESICEAIAKLEELTEAVRSDNSLFVRGEDRLTVMSELESFSNLLRAGSIRTATAVNIVRERGTLRWLADKAAGGVVGKLASSGLLLLLKIFGLG